MAQEKVLVRWCDMHLDRGERVEGQTVVMGLNGSKPRSTELCDQHLDSLTALELIQLLQKEAPRTKKAAAGKKPTAAQVRAWCRDHDVPVSQTGKVGKESVAAYMAAH